MATSTGDSQLERKLEKDVECPVCLSIPTQLPIPCCPAGHIVCSQCRSRVQTCPTCRRKMGDNTNSIAAAILDKVNHRCKYGCSKRGKLASLVDHEANICTERTVQCPKPSGCGETVKIKDFLMHVKENDCCEPKQMECPELFCISRGIHKRDGVAFEIGDEFDTKNDMAWNLFHIARHCFNFFFSAQYIAEEQLFLFYVMIQGGLQEAQRYTATIKLADNKEKVLSFEGPVLSLDTVPEDEQLLMESLGCFSVHYRAIRSLFNVVQQIDKTFVVNFKAEVGIFKKS